MDSDAQIDIGWRETIRVYRADDGMVGRWKSPVTGKWENKRVPKGTQDADSWFLAYCQEQAGATGPDGLDRRQQTLRMLVPRWQKHRLSLAGADPKKVLPACRCIERWAGELIDVPLEEMTVPQVAAWMDGLKKSGRADFTVRNILQTHRSLVIDARGMGWVNLKENPFADPYVRRKLKGIAPRAGKGIVVAIPATDAVKLASYGGNLVSAKRNVLNLVALGTGMRLKEVCALSWGDIRDDGTVNVFRQLHKGGFKPEFKEPKLGSSRVIPLHPLIVKALKWWKERAPVTGNADPVFPERFGFYGDATSAKAFREDLVAAGVTPSVEGIGGKRVRYTFHALRRTFASLLEENGVPREQIGGLLGHGGKGVTDRAYIRKSLKRYREAVSALPLPETVAWLK